MPTGHFPHLTETRQSQKPRTQGSGWVGSGADAGLGSTSPQPLQASEILTCAYTHLRGVDRNSYMRACSPSSAAAVSSSVLSVWLPHAAPAFCEPFTGPAREATAGAGTYASCDAKVSSLDTTLTCFSLSICMSSLINSTKKRTLIAFDPFRSFCLSHCGTCTCDQSRSEKCLAQPCPAAPRCDHHPR